MTSALDQKGLEAAKAAYQQGFVPHEQCLEAAIRAYLSTVIPAEIAEVVAEWTEAAKGVTPGEWLYCMYGTVVFKLPTMTPKGDLGFIATTIDDLLDEDDVDYPTTEARARWIARCSPDAIASLLTLIERLAASQAETERRTLERAARTAYRVCAETRHVTLGDKCSDAIRALIDQPSTEGGASE